MPRQSQRLISCRGCRSVSSSYPPSAQHALFRLLSSHLLDCLDRIYVAEDVHGVLEELGGLAVESGVDDVAVLPDSGPGNAHAAHVHDLVYLA